MKLIVCVDDNNGMMFNKRRQSRDKIVNERICQIAENSTLWITGYTSKMLGNFGKSRMIEIDKLDQIGAEDIVFLENISPKLFEKRIDEIIMFGWNRKYPYDMKFDIVLSNEWVLETETEFVGFSHEKITERTYRRRIEHE